MSWSVRYVDPSYGVVSTTDYNDDEAGESEVWSSGTLVIKGAKGPVRALYATGVWLTLKRY